MTVLSARLGLSVAEHALLERHDATSVDRAPSGVDEAATAGLAVHDHDWRLQEVWHEDGNATEEYSCTGCPGTMFR